MSTRKKTKKVAVAPEAPRKNPLHNSVVVKCNADNSWLSGFNPNGIGLFTHSKSERMILRADDARLEPFFVAPYEVRDITETPDELRANCIKCGAENVTQEHFVSCRGVPRITPANVRLQSGEQVIHINDVLYYEACEVALKQALKTLGELVKTFDDAAAGTMAFECICGIKTYVDGQDPLRFTEHASFVKKIETA